MDDEDLFHLRPRAAGRRAIRLPGPGVLGRRRFAVGGWMSCSVPHETPGQFPGGSEGRTLARGDDPIPGPTVGDGGSRETRSRRPPTAGRVPDRRGDVSAYKLLHPIGEGGMGTVFMAEQTDPVRRLVALKVIKAGMDSRQVLARFGAERQALALMDHPNIAKVLDAGATETGRPYFVMELVKGTPITRFCDERRLIDTAPTTSRWPSQSARPGAARSPRKGSHPPRPQALKTSRSQLYDGKPVAQGHRLRGRQGDRVPTDRPVALHRVPPGAVVGAAQYMSPRAKARAEPARHRHSQRHLLAWASSSTSS